MTQFEALYGAPPPSITSYHPGSTSVQAVDEALRDRDSFLKLLRENMHMAQNKMKQQADSHRSDIEFEIRDWVYLKLHPYCQQSVLKCPSHKLAPRYYGHFQVVDRIDKVAYKLDLPSSSRIHPVFHVSLLKKRTGDTSNIISTLPPFDSKGILLCEPESVLDMQVVCHKKKNITQWLIKWSGLPLEDATWENAQDIVSTYPAFGN
ncbi:uncharacterized protein LOC126792451 [Argentina anserina]|uniref:uncharacterized protein LOC126792451 n=1 Tax=Argentina anserina TaxID=57926 RepID=UPI0021766377|nr:uncharacterized protein LOC126792451 [Potentilla anserina]